MIAIEYNKKLSSVVKQRNIVFVVLCGTVLLVIFLIVKVATQSQTVVLIPSNLQAEMKISSDGKASKSYVEQFSRDIMYTMLNITPSSVRYANNAILKMSASKLHKDLAHQLAIHENDVIQKNISTYFTLHKISFTSKDNLSVTTDGELITFVGKDVVSKEIRQYQLKFAINGTKITLIGFNENKPKQTNADADLQSVTKEQYEADLMKYENAVE